MAAARRRARFAIAAALVVLLAACARPAFEHVPGTARTHSVVVLGHGHHTGIAVRAREVPPDAWPARRDFPHAEFLEIGWGDREYYPRRDPGMWLAFRALSSPTSSTLRVTAVTGSLARAFPESEIVELGVSAEGFHRMIAFVRDYHEFDAAGRVMLVPSELEDASNRFYASPYTFHAFENCNVWVARALEAAGLPLRPGQALLASLLLRQARPLALRSEPR